MKITVKRTPPPGLTLPDGYTLYDPGPPGTTLEEIQQGVTGEGGLYGGATMNWQQDGEFDWYFGANARKDNIFQFRVFELVAGALSEVVLPETGSGRGWMDLGADGFLYYSAWEGSSIRPSSGPGRVPGAAPLQSPSHDAYVPLTPNRYSPALDGQAISGGRSLDMASLFDLPANARAYCVRLVAQADRADVRARLGVETQPGQMTANTQTANLQIHQVGIVNAGAGGR